MKLKDSFIVYNKGDDHILIDSSNSFSGLAHSNKTAAFIMECLKSETTEAEIVGKMLEKYDATEEEVKKGVNNVIEKLRSIGALEE